MKHNILQLFTALLCLLSISIQSQNSFQGGLNWAANDTANYPYYFDMMQNPEVNFFQVQHAAELYFNNNDKGKGSGWKQYKRWEWFIESRVSSTGIRPAPDHVWNEYFNQTQAESINSPLTSIGGNWTELGPITMPNNGTGQPNGMGRINCVAFHPTNQNIIWVGAPSGGLWKTTNGGTTWASNTDSLPTLGVSSILINPTNTNTMYIGTGDRDAGDSPGLGVMKSTNGGSTWVIFNTGMGNKTVGKMIMHPTNANVILAATSDGIYKTTNGGTSWTKKSSNSYHYKDIVFKPANPNTVYATAYGEFYRSTNNGDTWSLVTSGLPTTSTRLVIGVTAADANYVYLVAAASDYKTFLGCYRSVNSGVSFSTQSTSPNIFGYSSTGNDTKGQASYDLAIVISPTNKYTIYVGGINIWKSTNGGTSWSLNAHWVGSGGTPSVHADIHSLDFSPVNNKLYCGNDGGLYYTSNGGTSWPEISSGLAIAQVYKIGQSATVANHIINGYQDNGTGIYSGTWNTEIGGDGMECLIDPTNSNYIYGALYYGDIRRSTNNGTNFYTIAEDSVNGINESGAWVTPYALHETNSNTMFIGYNNIWRSTNVKASSTSSVSWTKISNNLGSSSTDNVRVIEQSPANVNIFYAVKSGYQLFRSDNVNASSPTWTDLSSSLPNSTTPTDIEAHPTNQNTVYMTQSNKVYKSTNKGVSWTNISSNLPNVSVNCIVFDTSSNEGLYVGTDIGVYYKYGSMTSWMTFSVGLPVAAEVTELEIYYHANQANSRISACTYGRGLWQSDLYSTGSTTSINFSASSTTITTGNSINFTDLTAPLPTSWLWTFYGGTPSTSTLQNPTGIQYNTAGAYSVKLVVTNTNGTDSLTKTNYITVYTTSQYCTATTTTCDEYISNVTVGTINNSSLCGNYVDYTATHSTNMAIGSSYPITVTNGLPYSGDQCGIWIDWNQDGDFSDPNEAITVSGGTTTFLATIVPPPNAGAGPTLMRVRIMYTGTLSPCGITPYGEVEDYTIVVSQLQMTVDFSVNSTAIESGDSINFTDLTTPTPTSWLWTFSGGTPSTSALQNPAGVKYNSIGSFDVKLVVSNANITDSLTKTNYITVDYCVASSNTCDEYISNVTVGTINNSSLCGNYVDYTMTQSTNMTIGSSYPISVTNGLTYSGDQCGIWIDWNQNGDFYDSNEAMSVSGGTTLFTDTIVPPLGALSGSTRMRIRITYSGVVDPCGTTPYGEVEDYTIVVSSAASTLTVTPSSQMVSTSAGNTTFNVASNIAWTASDTSSWITLNPTSGNGNGIITATYTANTSTSPRTGTIIVSGTGVSNQVVSIIQSGVSPSLGVTPSSQSVTSSAGNTTFNVNSNISWTASDNASWLTIIPTSGNGNGTITATYTTNTSTSSRTATITVAGTGVSNQVVTVVQSGATAILSVTPLSQNVGYSSGNTTFNVTSNITWNASDTSIWLTVNPMSGTGNGIITATYTTNIPVNSRTAIINFTGPGVSTLSVTVVQSGSPVGLTENKIEKSIKIFPNPTNNLLNITCSENKTLHFKFYNVLGELFFEGEFKNIHVIDITKLAGGVYFIEICVIDDDFDRIVRRVVVEGERD